MIRSAFGTAVFFVSLGIAGVGLVLSDIIARAHEELRSRERRRTGRT